MLSVILSGETERGEYHPPSKWQVVFKKFLVHLIHARVAPSNPANKRPPPTACDRRFLLARLSNLLVASIRSRRCEQPDSESIAELFRRLYAKVCSSDLDNRMHKTHTLMKIIPALVILLTLLTIPAKAAPEEFSSTTIGIGVVVRDLDKSLDFYTNVIGMVQTGSFAIGADFSKKSGLAGGLATQVKVLRLGTGEEATQWKLMSFGDKAKAQQTDFIHGQAGMRYITIQVKDLTPILRRIKDRQIKLLGETPVPLGRDSHFALVQDPDGTFVELIGPLK
jgi:catechol 2,3-dioxygenase-like lactoylglutathione lyase family enzyme